MRPIKPNDEGSFNFDKQFRDNLRNMEVTPPAGLWDNLEGELDQQREQVRYNHWYYAAIVLLVFFAGFNAITSFDVEAYYAELAASRAPKDYSNTYLLAGEHPSQLSGLAYSRAHRINRALNYAFEDSEPLVTVSDLAEKRYYTPYISANSANLLYAGGYGKQGQHATRMEKAHQSLPTLELLAPTNLFLTMGTRSLQLSAAMEEMPTNLTKLDEPVATPKPDDIAKPKKNINALGHIKGFYVGTEYVFTGTRMFQKNSAFYPLLGKDAKYGLQKGYQYGVKIGYHFDHRMALELGWIINSAQGQRYSDNLYGKIPVSGNFDLTYTQVPLLFKYKFTRMSGLTGHPVSVNLIGGFAYSRLKASAMSINDDRLEDISDMVAQNELGVIMGVEYDVYVHRNLFVTFGGRAGMFADTQVLKGMEEGAPRTRNFMMGVSAAFNYQLPKRQPKAPAGY